LRGQAKLLQAAGKSGVRLKKVKCGKFVKPQLKNPK
jgi:hypothetical protein